MKKDFHIDPHYVYPSDPSTVCHRKSHDSSKNTGGMYGALRIECDSPLRLLKETFEFIKNNFRDVDFVIYTGDTLRHNFDPYIPLEEGDVLDGHRLAEGPNTLLDNVTEIWSPLNLNLTSDFTRGGYFRQDIHPKLSFLSLNSLYFMNENLEVSDCDKKDSAGAKQLKWLKFQLKSARKDHRKVYVPPLYIHGQKSYKPACLYNYVQMIGKYSDVIYGHFTGHTNGDTLTFVAASHELNEDVVLVLNNAPSIVPVNNPAIRVYKYSTDDENFGTLLDYTQYYTNLTEANEKGKLRWDVEYEARELYKVNKLRRKDWAKFTPNPIPLYLSNFTATLTGTTDVQITGGYLVALVYGYNNTYSICDHVSCPVQPGPFSFSGNVNIPSEVTASCVALKITGVKADVRAYDASGNILGCMQGS
ncbi:13263_t:CDS:2, partial [Dentiscutata erythropus]